MKKGARAAESRTLAVRAVHNFARRNWLARGPANERGKKHTRDERIAAAARKIGYMANSHGRAQFTKRH